MPRFITVGYVKPILGKEGSFYPTPPQPWAARKRPILNRVKISELADQ